MGLHFDLIKLRAKKYLTSITSLFLLVLGQEKVFGQELNIGGGIAVKAEITFGNQDQWLRAGILAFGVANYGDASVESGASFFGQLARKRHTKRASGFGYGYEAFALAGIGKNTDLLGSSISNQTNEVLFNPSGKGGFKGLGFGFEKETLPGVLRGYSTRRGALLMRFSNANHSIQLAFYNDFRFGNFIRGQSTDYAATGSLKIGFSRYQDPQTAYKLGVALELFTPEPDHSRSPENPINSDDGRKNVWFVLPPFKELFYANLYSYGTYQDGYRSLSGKLGLNSQKLGAFVQNTLHDGLGLNPRFPWNVRASDKLFLQLSGSLFEQVTDEN